MATLLLEGDVFVDQFKPQAVEDRARMELSRKLKKRQAALIDAVLNLEELSDAKQLARLLRAGARSNGGSDGARTRDLRRDRPTL